MAERSFKAEVEDLRLGAGETFTGEGILAITKALLDEFGIGHLARSNAMASSRPMPTTCEPCPGNINAVFCKLRFIEFSIPPLNTNGS